jgi:hypothetical protein
VGDAAIVGSPSITANIFDSDSNLIQAIRLVATRKSLFFIGLSLLAEAAKVAV